jgi:hypothetical protein
MTTILLFCLLCFCGIGEILSVKTYAPSWILKVEDHQKADQIARETGLRNVGQIGQLPNMYKLVNATGGRIPYHDITNLLRAYNEVILIHDDHVYHQVCHRVGESCGTRASFELRVKRFLIANRPIMVRSMAVV